MPQKILHTPPSEVYPVDFFSTLCFAPPYIVRSHFSIIFFNTKEKKNWTGEKKERERETNILPPCNSAILGLY